MKRVVSLIPFTGLIVAAFLFVPHAAVAAERRVVLSIPTMDCATCPITIRLALLKVSGVSSAVVSYRQREARVTFDDALTDITALRAATRDVGYPALVNE
jgi:periplasmic mercuric ion binding protein